MKAIIQNAPGTLENVDWRDKKGAPVAKKSVRRVDFTVVDDEGNTVIGVQSIRVPASTNRVQVAAAVKARAAKLLVLRPANPELEEVPL